MHRRTRLSCFERAAAAAGKRVFKAPSEESRGWTDFGLLRRLKNISRPSLLLVAEQRSHQEVLGVMNQLPEGLLLSHPAAEDSSYPEDHGSKHDHSVASLARVALWSLEDRPRPAFSTGWGAADKVEALRARARPSSRAPRFAQSHGGRATALFPRYEPELDRGGGGGSGVGLRSVGASSRRGVGSGDDAHTAGANARGHARARRYRRRHRRPLMFFPVLPLEQQHRIRTQESYLTSSILRRWSGVGPCWAFQFGRVGPLLLQPIIAHQMPAARSGRSATVDERWEPHGRWSEACAALHTFFGWLVVPLIAVVGARARWVPVLWKARHHGPMALAPSALYSSHE